MKKVLFFTTSGDYHGGGVMCLIETLKYIDRKKIEPYVVIPTHGSTENKLKELSVPYVIIRSYDWLFSNSVIQSKGFKIKRPLQCLVNILSEIRIYLYMRRKKVDAYHLNSVYSSFGFKAAMMLKIPTYWHLREFVDDNPWTSSFLNEKKAYQTIAKAHKLIAVSNCIGNYYQTKMPNAHIVVVYDGVDFNSELTIRKQMILHKPLQLSMIGGISEVKGHEDALYAVSLLKKSGIDCVLTIYGRCRDNDYFKYLNNIIRKCEIEDIVRFAGNRSDIQHVYEDSDIVLICSRSESFGRVAVECMYQNIPVIGADNSGTLELIKDGIFGLLYKTGDSHDLYQKIIAITKRRVPSKDFNRMHDYSLRFSAIESSKNLSKALLS